MSYNPFEIIETRLSNIEKVLVNLNKTTSHQIIEAEIEQPIYVNEAADLLGYKPSTIRTLCHKKKIPHSKRGKFLRFYKSQLIDWVNSGKRMTEDEILEQSNKI